MPLYSPRHPYADRRIVALTGASGFLGSMAARTLIKCPHTQVRLLSRNQPTDNLSDDAVWIRGDAGSTETLDELLQPGCNVINFAYDDTASVERNIAAASALAESCIRNRVRRIIHCSTAVVVGQTRRLLIDEMTECRPQNPYERTKLAVEEVLRTRARGHYELVVIRPTAVFGPGGRNLIKLANDLTCGSSVLNQLRAFANGNRRLNLVAVQNVVAAAIYLLDANGVDNETFIVSDDDHASNNFADVERCLRRELGLTGRSVAAKLPATALELLLRFRGRSLTNPQTRFSNQKLINTGFIRPVEFESALIGFASWYKHHHALSNHTL